MSAIGKGLTFQEMGLMQPGVIVRSLDPKARDEAFKIDKIERGMVFGAGIKTGERQGWYKTDCRIVQMHSDGGRIVA